MCALNITHVCVQWQVFGGQRTTCGSPFSPLNIADSKDWIQGFRFSGQKFDLLGFLYPGPLTCVSFMYRCSIV